MKPIRITVLRVRPSSPRFVGCLIATALAFFAASSLPAQSGNIYTIAGNGISGYVGDGGPATSAEIGPPQDIAVDRTGNLYIADGANNVIRKVATSTGIITTVAGNGTAGYSGDGGAATSAELNAPDGVAIDSVGNIYISDLNNNVVRKVTVSTGVITTVAGNGVQDYAGDGGPAVSAALWGPSDLKVDSAGNIYIADTFNNAVRKVTAATGIISTVAGDGDWGYSGDGGPATNAGVTTPQYVALDSAGNLYISSWWDKVIRKVDASTGIISTVVGNGTLGYSGDGGPATSAEISWTSVATDAAGNLYFADSGNNVVRKMTTATGIVTTIAGNGTSGYSGDGGAANSAELYNSYTAVVDSTGNLYIADTLNNRIRAIGPVVPTPTFSPQPGSYASPQVVTVSDSFAGSQIYYTTDGSTPTTSSNLYTGPLTIDSSTTLKAIAAGTGYGNSAVGTAAYAIGSPVTVRVSPSTATLYPNQTQQFSASVTNTSNTSVIWSISPAGDGAIDSTGTYTAPATVASPQTVTITATSQADPTKSASAIVTVQANCQTSGYSYVRAITIDHTKVPNSDQLNFPFLFSTTDPALATAANGGHVANSNGYDIEFSSDPAGLHPLNYEIEEYDSAAGRVIAWVNIPTVSHSTDTTVYLLYGNAAIATSQQNPPGVWDRNFVGVWHLPNGTVLSTADSTSYANNGTVFGTIATTGQIDGGAAFNGTSSYIGVGTNITTAQMNTVSTWAYINSLSSAQEMVSHSGNGIGVELLIYNGHVCAYVMGSSQSNLCSTTGLDVPGWNYISLTQGGPSAPMSLYINGASVGNTTTPSSIANPANLDFGVWANSSGRYFNGKLDEVQISSTVRSSDWIAASYNNQSSPGTFYSISAESTSAISPASVGLYASGTQQFTAYSMGTCVANINWTMSPAGLGTLTPTGLYTAPNSITAEQHVTIAATDTATQASATAVVTLLPVANPTLSLAASVQPPYVTGSTQRFVAVLKNQDGTVLGNSSVTFTVTGANPTSFAASTDATGTAIFSYTGANSGTDVLQATAQVGGAPVQSNQLSVSWIAPVQPISSSTLTGEFFFSNGSCSFNIPPTATPAWTQTFPSINFNPVNTTIPGLPNLGGDNARPMIDVTTDINGNYTGTIVAEGNGYQAGVNTSTYSMNSFQAVFRGAFTIKTPGNVVFNFFSDDGFIFGIGNGATRVSGATLNMPTLTPFSQYPAVGAYNGPAADVGNQVVVNFPAAGTYPYEVDYTECDGGQLTLTMAQGASSPTGIPPTGSLTMTPNTVSAQPIGGQETFRVVVTDASGAAVPNLKVSLVVSGANNLNVPATTDSSGKATFSYRDVSGGTDFVQVVGTIDGMVSYSNVVTVPWTSAPTTTPINNNGDNSTLSISVTAQNTVILPSTLQLSSTVTDSALQSGSSIALAWSQVSGPGAVTFSSPNTASSTASFTLPGAYVLKLSASDPDASDSVTVNVTVDPEPATAQGWIGSPQNGAIVSGVVPITVASGETLQSGTLTYYPANNDAAVTVLNANTTGTGQIGTFDTTGLPNGQYWITLQAIDSNGKSSYNLALVTVTGSYKPGRVTSTVTDLVVPSNGLAIQIQRTYDSLNAGTSGDFGYGWNLGTSVQLTVNPFGGVTFTLGGQRKTFNLTPQILGWFFPYYVPIFTPEPGLHGTLVPAGTGCPDAFDFLVPDGSLWACVGGGFYTPPGYVYTDPSGTAYTITASGQLQSIVDKNGNTLTIGATGITSSTGLSVPFQRDSKGRITQITDPQGNVYQYGYLDAAGKDNGNLQTVKYPNTSQSATYTYDSNHLYLSGTDFLGNSLPTTDYYQSTFDSTGKCQTDCDSNGLPLTGRLKSVTTSPGSGVSYTTTYSYTLSAAPISNPPNPNTVVGTTTITYPQDANGTVGTTTVGYNNYGDVVTSKDPLGNTTTNTYDANRNLLSTIDPLQHTTSYTYDANGNRISVTYPNPQSSTVTNTTSSTTYNRYSEPIQTVDELGNTRIFNYDVNFNPQNVTDGLGTLASFTFNSNGTMQAGAVGYDISVQPSMGSSFTYDQNGNLASRTDALGRTTSYHYNNLGQRTQMTTPPQSQGQGGAVTNYQYDPFGNLTETDAPLGRSTTSTYDVNGNKTSDTDGNGKTTSYKYDALNRLIETDYPDSTSTHRSYDFRGNVIDETDQAGNITHHLYDLAGRETSVTRGYGTPTALVTAYTYDNDGRELSETVGSGTTSAASTNYTYDAAGNLTGVSGPGGTFTYAFDNARNRISTTDGKGNKTGYRYDARKRLIETDYPDGTKTTNGYDGSGNLVSVTDQAGNKVQYTYDAANQLYSVSQLNAPDPSHSTTAYGYDNDGNLTGLTDANGHSTSNAYDLLNELTAKTLPDGSLTESRTYDQAGNLVSLTHFNGKTTRYTYDSEKRLLTRTPDSTLNEAAVSFTYTATGKRATMTDASGTTTYGYDSLDRLTSKNTPEGTLNYTYDAAGNLASMSSADGSVSVAYTWDNLNRLSTVVDNRLSGQNTTTYTYDSANNIATVTYPNGFHSMFSYDNLNRLTSMTASSNGYQYQLGPTGVRTNATESSSRSVTWSYDGLYRLTNETISADPTGYNGGVGYGLDPVGNRLSLSSTLSGISSGSFSFDADDRLSTESYDVDGNVASTGGKTFAYDSENHLVSMNNGAVSLLYDGDGDRVAKMGNGVTTRYLVDDLNPTGYPQVVEESVNGTVQRTYTYGLQRIDENQVVNNAWTPSFYGYDGMGNVRQLTNTSAATTDSYEYDAYGNLLNSTGTTPNAYMYRGEFFDSDLGLYYLRARWMNPLTGRFLSRDPEDGIPTDPITLQKYVYADSDPVNATDPTGRSALAEDVEVTIKIDIGALPAVAAAGCAVKLAYNVIALKVVNDFDITPTLECGAKGKGRMRIQLQAGTNVTVPGTPVLIRDDPPGVTKADAYAGLMQLWGVAQSPQSGFPFNANQSDLRSAIISISQCVKRQTGTAPGIYTVCRAYLTNSTAGWRIDLENLNGINLRQ